MTTFSHAAALSAALNAPLPPPDPLAAAAAALTASSSSMAAAAAELRGLNSHLRTKLDRVASRRALTREVMIADDTPAALAGLAVALAGVAPLHLVTTDRTAAAGLRALDAEGQRVVVHVVNGFDEVPGLVRRHRVAVAVVDVHLGDCNGAELVEHLPRGPRVVLVTSHAAARDSLVEVARATQSDALIRTDTGGWADVLRERVERGLREACGPT